MNVPKARKLASGTWFIQLRLGGESIPVSGATEKAVTREALRIKAEYKAGARERMAKKEASPTVGEAADEYIDNRRAVLSPSTIRGYKTIRENRFKTLWERRITDIEPGEWQGIVNDEAKLCSAKTLKSAWSFVRCVYRETTRQALPFVKLPQLVPASRPWLDYEQIQSFITAVAGEPCEIPALLALCSLRRSEIMGMDWKNIDLSANVIRVEGAAVYDDEQKLTRKATNKTKASRRVVPIIIPQLTEALKRERRNTGLLVTCNPNTLWAQINRVCTMAGLPLVGVHGLRHSFASLCYHLGLGEHDVMALGGWDDYNTVHKIYTHLSERDKDAAAQKLRDFFKNANENANKGEKA